MIIHHHLHAYEEDRPTLWPYLVASILLHLLMFVFFPYHVQSPSWKEKVVEVFPVTEKGSQPYEIADIAKPAVEKRPKSARFLGMYDSSVEQETVARTVRQKSAGSDQKREARKEKQQTKEKSKETADAGRMTIGKKKSLYDVDRKLFASKTPDIDSRSGELGGAAEALADYYPDYRIGARTYLNVLRYPDVEYFVRMKRQFKMTFNPVPPLRAYFAQNRVSRGSIEVVLAVSVNSGGNLSELFVLNSSGIPTYDQEAMRTIRASAPFQSPPDKFLKDDGLLRMSWTFTVYL